MMKPSLARPRIGRPKWLSFFLSFSPALARAAPIRWPSRAESSDSREEPAMSLWSEEKSHNIFAFWARARTIFASQQAKPVCLAELGSARAPLLFPPFLSEDPSSRWLQLERPAATHASARHTRASPLDAGRIISRLGSLESRASERRLEECQSERNNGIRSRVSRKRFASSAPSLASRNADSSPDSFPRRSRKQKMKIPAGRAAEK